MLCRAVLSVALGGLSPIGRRWVANLPPPRFFHVPLPNLNLKFFQKFSEIACKRFSRLTFKFGFFWSSKFYKPWPENLFSVIIGIFNLKLDQKFSILIWAGAGSVFENPNKILNTNPKNSNSGFRVFYIARSWDQNPHDFGLVGSWDFHFRDSGF